MNQPLNKHYNIQKLKELDHPSIHDLVKHNHAKLERIAKSLVGTDEAEAVVQEAWINVLKHINSFEESASIETWLVAIVINQAKMKLRYDDVRKESLKQSLDDTGGFDEHGRWLVPPALWHSETPDVLLENEKILQVIDKTLDALPPLQKAVLILHDIEGVDVGDICNFLEISASNYRVLLHRARTNILAAIDDQQQESEYVDLQRNRISG